MTRNALSVEAVGRRTNNVLLPHSIQAWDNDCWSNKVIEEQPDQRHIRYTPLKAWTVLPGLLAWPHQSSHIDTFLSAWTVIKEGCRTEPWIVLHGRPIEPMARWIQWNIGTDWSPIVIICRWFQWFWLSHNRPRRLVLPMYRSSSISSSVFFSISVPD